MPPSTRRSLPASTVGVAQRSAAAPFHPPRSGHRSERCTAAEFELLYDVVLTLGDRDRVIETQRPERRRPDQAYADRGPDNVGVIENHAASARVAVDEAIDFTRGCPRRRALVVPQRTGVGINRALQPDFLWQEPERHLQFGGSAPILGAADRVAMARVREERQ